MFQASARMLGAWHIPRGGGFKKALHLGPKREMNETNGLP